MSDDPSNVPDPTFLRLSAGLVYFFFGYLKLYPDLSPAELLASQSIMKITMNMVDANTALFWLAIFECAIGLSFLLKIGMRWLFFAFLLHQASTFLPLFIFPEITFKFVPFAPTLEGQYIFKNLVSVAAGWTVLLPVAKASWTKPEAKTVQRVDAMDSRRRQWIFNINHRTQRHNVGCTGSSQESMPQTKRLIQTEA